MEGLYVKGILKDIIVT